MSADHHTTRSRIGVAFGAILLLLLGPVPDAETQTLPVCQLPHRLQVDGLRGVTDTALLDQAQRPDGGGGLCGAVAYQVERPVVVYRVSAWTPDSSPDYFNWWSFENPSGPATQYRRENVMCGEWSVAMKSVCKLSVGARIAVGVGQSYGHCADGRSLPASSTLQVYLAGTRQDLREQLQDCLVERGLDAP